MKFLQSSSMALFVLSTACCPTQWALAQTVVTEPGASKIAPTAAANNEADKVPAVVPPTVPAPSNQQPAWGPVRWEAQPTAPIAGISNAECKANDSCSALDGLCCPTLDGMFLQCCTGERPDTAEPTSSAAPTMSAAPTVSSVPTAAPSVSPPPSMSAAPVSNETTAVTATCESNPVCNDLELSGICCPTVDGFGFLDCCSNVTEGTKASSAMEYIAFIEGSGTSGATAWTLAAQPVTTMAGMLLSATMLLLLH